MHSIFGTCFLRFFGGSSYASCRMIQERPGGASYFSASPLWVVAGAATDRKEGPSYGTPQGMPQVEILLYCVLKEPLIS